MELLTEIFSQLERDTRGIKIKNKRVRLSLCADLIRYLEHQKESTQELLQMIRQSREGAGRERHRSAFSNYLEGIAGEKTPLRVTMMTGHLGISSPRNAQNPQTGSLQTRQSKRRDLEEMQQAPGQEEQTPYRSQPARVLLNLTGSQ